MPGAVGHTGGRLSRQAVHQLVGVDEGQLGQHQQQVDHQRGALRLSQLGHQRRQQPWHNGPHLQTQPEWPLQRRCCDRRAALCADVAQGAHGLGELRLQMCIVK